MMAVTSLRKAYTQVDSADQYSCRPDFGILIYPAYLVDRKSRDALLPDIKITSNTPPCFFVTPVMIMYRGVFSPILHLKKRELRKRIACLSIWCYGYGMRKNTIQYLIGLIMQGSG